VPTTKSATILIIEDEADIRRAIAASLQADGHSVREAGTGQSGLDSTLASAPDLIILDLGLPDIEGLTVCKAIRNSTSAPIIILTARQSEAETVALLNAGADDYVKKPFSIQELTARVTAMLRRAGPLSPSFAVISSDGMMLDVSNRTVSRGGEPLRLTPIEWDILVALASYPGRVITHQQLFDAVWKRPFGDARQYLRVHLTNLRRKIERDPANPRIIVTEPGVGYRFAGSE
jgi:two-component system KDP operon response regulator KdpE